MEKPVIPARLRVDRNVRRFMTCLIVLPAWAWPGCPPANSRLNSPPQGFSDAQHPMSEYYAYHNDQGMISDMSIADIHFIPHSADLSGTGIARLERYSELLATSGGTIHYDTAIGDPDLIKARLASAKTFLRQALPGGKEIEIAMGLPGGRGISAKEAKTGTNVALQAEPRTNAYRLNVYTQGNSSGN